MDSVSPTVREELLSLVSNYCQGQFSMSDGLRLETILKSNSDAQRLYVEYLDLHVALRKRVKKSAAAPTADEAFKVRKESPPARKPVLLRVWGRVTHNSPIVTTLCVACLVYGSFGLLVWQMGHYERGVSSPVAALASPVAKLVASESCQWQQNEHALKVGDAIMPGMLGLVSGVAEFEFADGARVVLEGPARFEPLHAGECLLERGKLVARVPQRAIGFSVETPTARVVDLGTEFAVEVDDKEATDVEVLKGTVELQPRAAAGDAQSQPQKSIRLGAGSARRIETVAQSGGVVVREISPNSSRFTRKATTSQPRQLVVQGAIASSENGGYHAKALIDGSGMQGDRHATYHYTDPDRPPYHMWLSAYGKTKYEFVLFDFGKPCRLESMKVWNLNDGRDNIQTSRGTKQADIYVSTSGKWDPLKEPNEWKLVVDDFKFSIASGTDDYDTPDVIALGNAEARFVAIVIDDHLGPDPRGVIGQDCVGLSEVQFFGERVTPAKHSTAK
jgi:hypothetical protein